MLRFEAASRKGRNLRMRSRQCERYSGVGAVSSVGERFLDTEEVISSILIPPTIAVDVLSLQFAICSFSERDHCSVAAVGVAPEDRPFAHRAAELLAPHV